MLTWHNCKLSQYLLNNLCNVNKESISNVVTNPNHQSMELVRVKVYVSWGKLNPYPI